MHIFANPVTYAVLHRESYATKILSSCGDIHTKYE